MRPANRVLHFGLRAALLAGLWGCQAIDLKQELPTPTSVLTGERIASLSVLSIESLRARSYHSKLSALEPFDRVCPTATRDAEVAEHRGAPYIVTYDTEGLKTYARVDIPIGPAPDAGYPLVIFAHGWVGAEAAPTFHFGCDPSSIYRELIEAFANAGFVVVTPGYRGHGTFHGAPAEGIEDVRTWDTGAYLMPSFYAVDVMNLLAGVTAACGFHKTDPDARERQIRIDPARVFIDGHSQGGDVALTVLAAVGEGAASRLSLAGGSIWAGNIPDRFSQLRTFEPMQTTPEAFLAGDGSWNGSAIGADGKINANFVFGYPSDAIQNPDPATWTWQKETWAKPSTQLAVRSKLEDMYKTLRQHVGGLPSVSFKVSERGDGAFEVLHDPQVQAGMIAIGGYDSPDYLSEPLNLHFSDRDFYSLPQWNLELCARANSRGGNCKTFLYPANTHSLRVSSQLWFSPQGTVAGFPQMIARDVDLFSSRTPAGRSSPRAER